MGRKLNADAVIDGGGKYTPLLDFDAMIFSWRRGGMVLGIRVVRFWDVAMDPSRGDDEMRGG